MNQKWYALPKEEILKLLNTSAAAGLSPKAARLRYRKRLQSFTEEFLYIAKTSLLSLLSSIFSDVAVWILLITLSVMACFRETEKVWICLALLLLHITLSVCLGKIVSLRKEEISRIASPKICVLRDGNLYRTDFRHVVQGDIVLLEDGDIVPFDLRLLTSDRLTVSAFVGNDTDGKPKYVKREKDAFTDLAGSTDLLPEDQTNMITAGSIILSGTARGVVVECGMASSTAIAYGVAVQGVEYVLALLDKVTNVKYKKDAEVYVGVDYLSDKTQVDVSIAFSLRVWHLFDILFRVAFGAVAKLVKQKNNK